MRRLIASKILNFGKAPASQKGASKRNKGRTSKRASKSNASWRKKVILTGIGAAISASLGLIGFAFVSDKPQQYVDVIGADLVQWTVEQGYYVADVQAIGRKNTTTHEILKALNVGHATPILTLDLEASQHRIEALPWVKSAQVERHLPNILRVVIRERIPVAIAQSGKKSLLIDASGAKIIPVREDINNLPIITGKGAPQHVADLIKTLNTVPELAKRVKAAVRVGNRRWNVRLDTVVNGIEIRLPEANSAQAWQDLERLQERHGLLRRDVAMIDLRLPDRLVVRLSNGQTLPPSKLKLQNSRNRKKGVSA